MPSGFRLRYVVDLEDQVLCSRDHHIIHAFRLLVQRHQDILKWNVPGHRVRQHQPDSDPYNSQP